MNSVSSVVEQLSSELAERRRTSLGRRSAYVALARAIVVEEQSTLLRPTGVERQPVLLGQTPRAA